VSPQLPPNIKLGQLRKRYAIVDVETRTRDERDVVDAFLFHLYLREQGEYSAFEDDLCVFLSNGWMRGLLRAIGARKKGWKAAAKAIAELGRLGVIEDTGRVKKPARSPERVLRAKHFQPRPREGGEKDVSSEGGYDAQPTSMRSYWWRVFRVPALAHARERFSPQGAYSTWVSPWGKASQVKGPHSEASLSAFLRRQGLVNKPKGQKNANRGSVQWAFAHSGPP
jgi:hypothetical protein